MVAHRPPTTIKAWRPPVPGIAEVFHAHFTDHAYPAHTQIDIECPTLSRARLPLTIRPIIRNESP
ncbi:hypothetical protein [Sphaerisporangium fuscum]|uniref:hypothetical protein n=1 Tax=Sphaerisporangium fuscum TaxID=2835868 RepID=UPI001BDCAC20|nr:hypothetical protein [Sphaerisporangium fuscum]